MSDRRITLFLVDHDPIFRLGLTTALDSFPDLQVLAQGNLEAILLQLRQQQPDILVVDPGRTNWQLYLTLKQDYPQIKICLLSASLSSEVLLNLKRAGVEGYCAKGTEIEELVTIIRQIAQNQQVWSLSILETASSGKKRLSKWIAGLIEPGLQQIEQNILLINQQLQKPHLSWLDWLFWTGRRRELLATRWLVHKISLSAVMPSNTNFPIPANNPPSAEINTALPVLSSLNVSIVNSSPPLSVTSVLENTLTKIQIGGENKTHTILEIDILKADGRRDLLYLVFSKFRQIIAEFPTKDTTSAQLQDKLPFILQEIWAESLRLFLEIYYPNKTEINQGLVDDLICQESREITQNTLSKIPFSENIFSYFMYQSSIVIDKIEYSAHTPEAMSRVEILLQNLIIKIANAIMAVILNNFFESEAVISKLFKSEMRSAREIAKFRNNLSWQYKQQKYWQEPKEIFDSQYNLFYLDKTKINQMLLYSSRQQELQQLTGLQWTVTIVLEARDAIAPRLRRVIALLGEGLVYILTQVIGRGIGLIGRGIIQGVGNTFQDVRYGKNSKQ